MAPQSERPGPIVDSEGTVLGEHRGVSTVTIGQRKGLGVALGEPRHVIDVIPETATVVLGRRDDLAVRGIELEQVTWVDHPLDAGASVGLQYRAHGEAVEAVVTSGGAEFRLAQYGVAPGQTVAFYEGEQVLGSGVISATRKSNDPIATGNPR